MGRVLLKGREGFGVRFVYRVGRRLRWGFVKGWGGFWGEVCVKR